MGKTRRCRAALHCAAAQSRPVGIGPRPEDDLTGSGEGQASKTGSQRRRAGAGCRRGRAKGGMRQRDGLHPLQVRHHSQSDPWDWGAATKRAGNASVTVLLVSRGRALLHERAGRLGARRRALDAAALRRGGFQSHCSVDLVRAVRATRRAVASFALGALPPSATARRWSLRTSSELRHAELTTRCSAAKVCPIAISRNARAACATLLMGNHIQISWFSMSTA